MREHTVSREIAGTDMPTAYDPRATEKRWYQEWERRGYFSAKAGSGREPFCIVLPPPNVTGALHIGHAFQQLHQDIVIRRKRMQGYETLWLPGTDHAGITTQIVVERQLMEEGIDRRKLGREGFVERVWAWKEEYGNRIVEQMKAFGNSCDWSRLRFTMDPGLARAVRVAFVRLYEEGLIYRGERIVNWCPRDETALSDSEVEHEDADGELVTFRYDLADGSGHADVATTRIETMLGDTGVAVHPEDQRYRHLVGKRVRHPFTGEELPIVADEAVDASFGTGAVKVTPAHDPTDFEIGQRHALPLRNILTSKAQISDAAPQEFRGLDRYAARARVLERLREMGKVVKVERPYVHSVGHCYRCGDEIEPWIAGKQWFVAVERMKGPAKASALDGSITFWPRRWIHAYVQWLDGLRDWTISRQLWWGHRIPVWYCSNGHQFAALEDPDVCPECGSAELEQDPDVIDPLEAIERYGADALRFGLAYQATDAQSIPYGDEHTDAGRRFANKIWNAARLLLSASQAEGSFELPSEERWSVPDRWLLSRHQACWKEVEEALEAYRIADALRALHRFFWSEFCDWSLEAAKPRLYEGTEEDRRAAAGVLGWVLERSLRLLHPFMPFVTEEVWQRLGAGESIMISPWPEPRSEHGDPKAESQFAFAMELIGAIRRFRKSHGIRDSLSLSARVAPRADQRGVLEALRPEIERLANISTLEVLSEPGDPAGFARLVADGAQVLVPLAGVLDPEVERARLSKRLGQIEAEAEQVNQKLRNERFVAKAPEDVVQKERSRLAALREKTAALAGQLEELG